VIVIGAGAFGGWTALELVRRGARVTLLDAWGPGNARASSGGETRIIRAGYGSRAIYTRLARRALERWQEHDRRFGRGWYRPTGALWLSQGDRPFVADTFATLTAAGVAVERLGVRAARRRYPQVSFAGVDEVLLERDAGYLLARRASEHVVERVIAEGGTYRQAAVAAPVRPGRSRLTRLALGDGGHVSADQYVFACGPWLGALFPGVIGRLVTPTRQDVFYFGTPPGDPRFEEAALPVWVDVGARLMYGIPGNAHRGFKIGDDTPGPVFDPTSGARDLRAASLRRVRTYLGRRFPALARAPLVGFEVCQYEATPDSHFIVDRHPGADNVWLAGGGSGHGFKMGPAIGEMIAALVLGAATPEPAFALARFTRAARAAPAAKWT
jgi:glycine/D-amino acid oxidase-like deaminating enzyme